MKRTFYIPDSLDDIPLNKYNQYAKIDFKDVEQEFINRQVLKIFFDIKPSEYTDMSNIDVDYLVSSVIKVLNEQPPFQSTFKHRGIEWGFVPNLDKLTYGAFVDLQSVEGDLLKMMGVLYQPITKKHGDKYKVKKYKGYSKNTLLLQDMPLSVVVGSLAFFLNLWRELLNYTLNSLEKTVASEAKENAYLAKNGIGIQRFLQLQAESLNKLIGLHPLAYMKHSYTSVT